MQYLTLFIPEIKSLFLDRIHWENTYLLFQKIDKVYVTGLALLTDKYDDVSVKLSA